MRLRLTVSILLAAAAVSAADTTSFEGDWQLHNSISGSESDMSCTFTQKAAAIAGSCNGAAGTVTIAGKADGKKITWVFKSVYEGNPITLTYKGEMDEANHMQGTVNVQEYGVDGDFAAIRAK